MKNTRTRFGEDLATWRTTWVKTPFSISSLHLMVLKMWGLHCSSRTCWPGGQQKKCAEGSAWTGTMKIGRLHKLPPFHIWFGVPALSLRSSWRSPLPAATWDWPAVQGDLTAGRCWVFWILSLHSPLPHTNSWVYIMMVFRPSCWVSPESSEEKVIHNLFK